MIDGVKQTFMQCNHQLKQDFNNIMIIFLMNKIESIIHLKCIVVQYKIIGASFFYYGPSSINFSENCYCIVHCL